MGTNTGIFLNFFVFHFHSIPSKSTRSSYICCTSSLVSSRYNFGGIALTNIEIKGSQPKEKESPLSDGAKIALLIKPIKPNGAKLWHYRFSRGGKAQKLSLGATQT